MTEKDPNIADALAGLGRPDSGNGRTVNMPLYQGSTLLFDSLADFEEARNNRYNPGQLYYGRYGTPATFELEKTMARLERADQCITVSSGLAAISITLLAVSKTGNHILVADNVYSPTRRFCDTVLKRFGVEVTYFDPMLGANIEHLFQPDTCAVMFEAPGSETFEVPDIPAITGAARKHGAISILDGTWATPVFCHPIQLGVDIVVHSGSKYIAGHADVMIGFIVCNDKHYPALRKTATTFGERAGSQDVYLSLRGLRTLQIRMQQHQAAALEIAEWLAIQPQVIRILHPAIPDCPGHAAWQRDFNGASGLFSALFHPVSTVQLHRFIDSLKLFGIGVSWGGYESLALPVNPKTSRTVTQWESPGQLVRFNIGSESPASLVEDLSQSLVYLNTQ